MRRIIQLVSTIGVVLLVAACGLGDRAAEELVERAAEQAGADNVEVDRDEGGVKVETSEGTFAAGAGAELPDWFPEDFPLAEDHEVFNVAEGEREGRRGGSVGLTTPLPFDEVASFYEEGLPAAGYEITEQGGLDGDGLKSAYFKIAGNGFEGMLNVQSNDSSDPAETHVQITIGEEDADSG